MTWGFVAIAGGTAYQAYSANQAAKAQLQGAREGAAAEREMFERQVQLQAPFREAGLQGLNKLLPMAMNYKPFSLKDFEVDPGYEFRRREGLRAIENSALAGGMGRSGSTLRGLTRYGQELGSEEFMNAFNRYQTNRSAEMNPLLSLAGAAQTSSNTLGNAAGQLGSSLSNLAVGSGNARASAYAGTANALASGLGQALNYSQGQTAAKQQQQNFDAYMRYLQG
jgi:hypothetical protein